MTSYTPSRNYFSAGLIALGFAVFSGWCAVRWAPASVAAVLFLVSAGLLLFLAWRPAIEVHEHYLAIGKRKIYWGDIQRVDRTGWVSPLVLHLSLVDRSRVLLIYPGDPYSSGALLKHLQRYATEALLDGVPHSEYWKEAAAGSGRKQLPSPRYRLLREEDEAEVERLFQRLKSVGHLDPKNSDEN